MTEKAKKAAGEIIPQVQKLRIADESVEAVVLVNDRVDIYLKSGSVIPAICIDEIHADIRYEAAAKMLPTYGVHSDNTEIDDIDEYLKEQEKQSSSSGK